MAGETQPASNQPRTDNSHLENPTSNLATRIVGVLVLVF